MEIANLVLEFIKVILSAPVIAGVVVLRLAMIFRAEISSFDLAEENVLDLAGAE